MKVCTTKQLAAFYGCGEENIQDNYRRNSDRFVEGAHFFLLEGDSLRKFKNSLTGNYPVSQNVRNLILWTEKGAARQFFQLEQRGQVC